MKIIICLPFLILFFYSPKSNAKFENPYFESLNLISKGKIKPAVKILKKLIRKEKNPQQRTAYAALLAQMPLSVNIGGKRHQFAAQALDHPKFLDPDHLVKLSRIAGDGYFEEAELEKAILYYSLGLDKSLSDNKEISYINYKLGFVYINQREYLKSFPRLVQAYEQDKTKTLQETIAYDIGKTWSESQFFKTKVPMAKLSHFFLDKEKMGKEIAKGILSTFKKFPKKKDQGILTQISDSDPVFFKILMEHLIDSEYSQTKESCDFVLWLAKLESPIKAEKISPTLNSCSKKVVQKQGAKKKEILEALAKVYGQIKIQGKDRFAYSQILQLKGESSKACFQLLEQVLEGLAKPKSSSLSDSLALAGRSCHGVTQSPPKAKIKEVVKTLLSKKNRFLQKSKDRDPLIQFLQFPFSSKFAIENFRNRKSSNETSFVYRYIQSSNEAFGPWALDFLKRNEKPPLKGEALAVLIKLKPSLDDLKAFLPLKQLTEFTQIQPWLQSLQDKKLKSMEEVIFQKALSLLPKEKAKRLQTLEKMAKSLIIGKKVSFIAQHWKSFQSIFSEEGDTPSLLLSACLQENLCNQARWSQIQSSDPFLKFLKKGFRFLKNPLINFEGFPDNLQKHRLVRDSKDLQKEFKANRELAKKYSRLKVFEANIDVKVLGLKNTVDHYGTRNWYTAQARKKMFSIMNERVRFFSAKLKKLAKNSSNSAQYLELSQVVGAWTLSSKK